MRSALLLTLCACLVTTAGRIALLAVPAAIRPLPQMLLTLLAFGGCAYLGLCVLDGDQRKMLAHSAPGRAQILHLALLGILAVCPMTLLSDLWRALFSPGVSVQYAGIAYGADAALFLVQLISSALLAPICEELFFRGYLQGALERYGRGRAVAAAALCFALVHGMNVGALAVHALLGVLLGALMIKTRTIYAPMLVHGCYNLTVILISYSGLTPLFSNLTLVSCVLRLLGCAAFAAALRKAYVFRASVMTQGERQAFDLSRKEAALLIAALMATICACVISGVTA